MGVNDRKEKEKTDRRVSIINAALKVFGEKGFHETTIEDVAKTAQLGKGTLYLYFKDKSELFTAMVEHNIEELTETLRGVFRSEKSPKQKITGIVDSYLGFFEKNHDFFKIFTTRKARHSLTKFSEINNDLKSSLKDTVMSKYILLVTSVSGVLQQGIDQKIFRKVDTLKTSFILVGMMNSMIGYQIFSGFKKSELEEAKKLIEEIFLDGIKK